MSEEMLLESVPWESDESEDSESDEAFFESEDSAEDYGEARRPRRPRRPTPRNRFVASRGVRGVRIRGADGRVRNLPFPAKLATSAETNRGLASQEVGRRDLEQRLDRIETGIRVQQKKDSATSGVVYLGIGGGLTAWSLIQAGQQAGGRSFLGSWASQNTAQMATLASVTQIATSGAKLLINGRYHGSGVGIVADAVAAVQAAGFAIASLYKPAPLQVFASVADAAALKAAVAAPGAKEGDLLYQVAATTMFQLRKDIAGVLVPIPL